MKKIVFLEMNADGPTQYHSDLFNNDKCDFFYVTFKKNVENDSRFLGFFPQTVWGETRNKLYELVPKNYEYYCFIDDDIIFESKTDIEFIDQLLVDLERTKPIVLSPYYINNNNEGKEFNLGHFYLNYFGNNCCKIYNSKYLNFFYELITKYGGTYDSAHLVNILELIFENKILCSHNLTMINPDHKANYPNGKKNMENMWDDIKYLISDEKLMDNCMVIKDIFLKKNNIVHNFESDIINFEKIFKTDSKSWIYQRYKKCCLNKN